MPVLVAGDWGSGKSSLMLSAYNRIRQKVTDAQPPCAAIWFEAWHYERMGSLLPMLIHAIFEASPDHVRKSVFRREEARKIVHVACALFGRVAVGRLLTGDESNKAFMGLLDGTGARALYDDATVFGRADAGLGSDPIKAFRESVSKLLRDAWPDEAAPYPVVFVDDLDRCSPEGMVELIDAIRLLVSGATELGCRFVVALDRDVAVDALSRRFAGLSRFDGNRYLEKVFPLCLHVANPSADDVRTLVRNFLEPEGDGEGQPKAGALIDHDDQDTLAEVLRESMFANPRLIKRCVDRLHVLKQLETWTSTAPADPVPFQTTTRQGTTAHPDPSIGGAQLDSQRALVQWLAASERWPLLRRIARSHGDDFWQQLTRYLNDDSGRALIDPELRRLVDEPTFLEWLKTQGARRVHDFKSADERLTRSGL